MKTRGFTLLEVLIAGVILFAAISAAAMVYTSAAKSAVQASKSLSFSAQVPLIVETVKTQLRNASSTSQQSGEGALPYGRYTWLAAAEKVQRPKPVFSGETGSINLPDVDIVLWKVTLNVEIDNTERQYDFKVTGWVG